MYTRESILTSSILTLFFFDVNAAQIVGRRVRTKVIEGKGPRIYQIIPTFDRQGVFYCLLNTLLMPAFELRLSLNCTKQEAKESVTITANTTKLKTTGTNTNAPKVEFPTDKAISGYHPNPRWRESQNRPWTQRKILISNT